MRGGRSDGYTDKVGGAICEVGGAMDILFGKTEFAARLPNYMYNIAP